MTVNASVILQALIVSGLLATARVLWNTVIKLTELNVRVDDHGRRLGVLEER